MTVSFCLVFSLQVPGGIIEDSKVLNGVMINKDVTHPKMKRRIENPKILLLDCSLEYKKGESQVSEAFMTWDGTWEQNSAMANKVARS